MTRDRLIELSVKQECLDLLARYAVAVNRGDLDAFVALWAPDAFWQRPAGEPMRGRAEIRAFMGSLPDDRMALHVNGASRADVIDEDRATGWSQTMVYGSPRLGDGPGRLQSPSLMVEYEDEYRRHDGELLFAQRLTTWVMVADAPPPGGDGPRAAR